MNSPQGSKSISCHSLWWLGSPSLVFPAVTLWGVGQETRMAVRTSHSPRALQPEPQGLGEPAQLQEPTGILLPALSRAGGS